MLKDDQLVEAIESDYRTAGLAPSRVAMLAYAEKLTRAPNTVRREDVDSLRDAGFGDTDILHIAEATAYYAYVNRIADGLGVEIENGADR